MSNRQWSHLNKILTRNGPFVQAGFNDDSFELIKEAKILVVGAGGLGCEMLKDLALMGFINIHVIDCDTIEISNLNRQFLFRTKDLGRSKAVVAAEFINNRISGCKVVPHFCKIEDKELNFYFYFNIIVCGLDAIGPRKWLNQTLFGFLEPSPDGLGLCNIIPMVDGGTEGFKGNFRVIIPSYNNPCVECNLDLYPPQETYPLCTLTQRPRLPEHCIEYVKLIQWPQDCPFGDISLDGDDPLHLQWIYERSLDRANEYGIEGVTYRLTQGVVKNIIPAVASTNATIAAACCTEVFKLMTCSAPLLNNYMILNNSDGIYTYTYAGERKSDCSICNLLPLPINVSRNITLKELLEQLQNEHNLSTESTSVTTVDKKGENKTLFMTSLKEQTSANLFQTLQQLDLQNGQSLSIVDKNNYKKFIINFI